MAAVRVGTAAAEAQQGWIDRAPPLRRSKGEANAFNACRGKPQCRHQEVSYAPAWLEPTICSFAGAGLVYVGCPQGRPLHAEACTLVLGSANCPGQAPLAMFCDGLLYIFRK